MFLGLLLGGCWRVCTNSCCCIFGSFELILLSLLSSFVFLLAMNELLS